MKYIFILFSLCSIISSSAYSQNRNNQSRFTPNMSYSPYISSQPNQNNLILQHEIHKQRIEEQVRREAEIKQRELFKAKYKGFVHLYGGNNHDIYLGCLNCASDDELSIWNKYGTYGKNYTTKNIWSSDNIFGISEGDFSPWSLTASSPPVIVDFEGVFYGYFTSNYSFPKRTSYDFALYILENFDNIKDSYDEFVESLNE